MGKSKDLATLTNGGNIAGNFTVDTDTLHVDSTNDRIGFGTTSPSSFSGYNNISVKGGSSGSNFDFQNSSGTRVASIVSAPSTQLIVETLEDADVRIKTNNVERLIVDGSGRVTTPNQPSFAVTKNNGHVTAGNVYIFNSTEYSVGSMYNTSNGRGTAPVAGRYFVSTWLMSEANATYNNKSYQIRKNGSIVKSVYSANGGNNHHQWSWAGLINLSANDYIDVYTDNMTLYGTSAYYSQFCMHLLS